LYPPSVAATEPTPNVYPMTIPTPPNPIIDVYVWMALVTMLNGNAIKMDGPKGHS